MTDDNGGGIVVVLVILAVIVMGIHIAPSASSSSSTISTSLSTTTAPTTSIFSPCLQWGGGFCAPSTTRTTSTTATTTPSTTITIVTASPTISNMGTMSISKSCTPTTCTVTATLTGYDTQIPYGNLDFVFIQFPHGNNHNAKLWTLDSSYSNPPQYKPIVFIETYDMDSATGLAYSKSIACHFPCLSQSDYYHPLFQLSGSQTSQWEMGYEGLDTSGQLNHQAATYFSDSGVAVP